MAGYFRPGALDDPEVCALTDNEHNAWVKGVLQELPRCGIFRPNFALWSLRTRCPLDALPAAFDTFESLGWVQRDTATGYIWIKAYTKNQSRQAQWLNKACKEVEALLGRTELAEQWFRYHAEIGLISERNQKAGQDRTDRTGQDSFYAPTSRPVEDAEWVQLAREVHWYICHQAAKHKIAHAGFKNDPQECGRELRLLVENDKVPLESILPSLAWAWGYEFADRQHPGALVRYGSVLLSIKRWRPTKFKTMQEQWLRQTSGDTGQNERIRKAICDGMAKGEDHVG